MHQIFCSLEVDYPFERVRQLKKRNWSFVNALSWLSSICDRKCERQVSVRLAPCVVPRSHKRYMKSHSFCCLCGCARRPIFVWRPELAYPEAFEGGRPPCPRCKTSTYVTSKGWMQHGSRKGILREGSCDLTCYWYSCKKCREDNKDKPKVGILNSVLVCLALLMRACSSFSAANLTLGTSQ